MERVPEFNVDPPLNRGPVQVYETVYLAWIIKEVDTMEMDINSSSSSESF